MHTVVFILFRRMHTPLIVLICVYAVSILGFVLIPGVDDQGNPWRMSFFHAFYFVSFMGSTIGFGEIPYAFTDAQRLWATLSIYGTVIAWLYGIGTLLSLVQESAFRELMIESTFRRRVRRIREPFYLVCGYGDTGSLLVSALTDAGLRTVVVEIDQERINALEVEDLRLFVPALRADASAPDALVTAGLKNKRCVGVVALTDKDSTNLKIAITAKLLNPRLTAICRAETHDAEVNIASFGTDHVINPFDTFAGRLALALHSPGIYLLYEWMTSVPHETLPEPLFPPRGNWVLCGYGRFGKALQERLSAEGLPTTIVEADPERTQAPEDAVIGRGTEADTLLQADVCSAVGIVAGTDDDANNLSIIMTARELNPHLFIVARQNERSNDAIFKAAKVNLIMQRGSIVAHKIFALITTPLLGDFLVQARRQSNDWANRLVSRIGGVAENEVPTLWDLTINADQAPAVNGGLFSGRQVSVGALYRDPRNRDDRLNCLVLLIKRHGEFLLEPEDATLLQPGDRLLFCGRPAARAQVDWVVKNHSVFNYIYTGEEHPSGYVLRWLVGGRRRGGDVRGTSK